ncbi:DNA-directed RNA polymerase I subunit RPA34.5-domain-containing protein [Xylaria digitata]|nr:DNA-directed RNA polymerase I subunit RPA34.5-domain-containing protein [Xylaria digitata]
MRSSKANIGSLSSMASKVRQEKKNSASAKAKAPLARARESKKSFLSSDKVVDSSSDRDSDSSADIASGSDSDGDLDAARAKFLASKAAKQKPAETKVNGLKPVATTPAKPVPKGTIPTSAQKPADESASDAESESGTSDSDSSSSGAKPVTTQNKSSVSKAKSKSSTDSTSSSGTSSDSEEVGAQKAKVSAREESESDSNSDSDSDSDDEDTPSTSAQASAKRATKTAVRNAQESSSDGSDSDSGSESDDEGDGGKTTVAKTNGKDAVREPTLQVSRAQWLNNADFMLRKASSGNPGKEVSDFFSNANLEGKQVWYFTAPASLPITVLKDMEIDLSKATSGGALLTHDGDNYGLDLESYATNTQIQLLIPSHGGDKYKSLNRGIDSTVHLRRMTKFGPGGEVHATATDDYAPLPKPIREQPEGLRVRYTPIGVPTPTIPSPAPTKKTPASGPSSQQKMNVPTRSSSGSEGDSDEESDVEMTAPPTSIAPPSQTKPAKLGLPNGDRKRKHPGDEDQAAKRLKGIQSTEKSSTKKSAPAQAPTSSEVSISTPSKTSSTKIKDKKEKAKKEKTPKSVAMTPSTAKQTPIPLPTYPGMRR